MSRITQFHLAFPVRDLDEARHFYGDVIGDPMVKIGLVGLGIWLLIGNLVMRRMIDMRI